MLNYNDIYEIGIQASFEAALRLDKYTDIIAPEITEFNQIEDKKFLRKICKEGAEILDKEFNTDSNGDFFRIAELAQMHESFKRLSTNYKQELKDNREFSDYAYVCEMMPLNLEINNRVALYNYQYETKSNPIIDAYFDSESEFKTLPSLNGNYTVENLINYIKEADNLKLLHDTYLNEQFKIQTNEYTAIPSFWTKQSYSARTLEETIGAFLYCHDAAREAFPAQAYKLAKALDHCKEHGLLEHRISEENMKETGFRVYFNSDNAEESVFLRAYEFVAKTNANSISVENVIGEHGNIFNHGVWSKFSPDDFIVYYVNIEDSTKRTEAVSSLKKYGIENASIDSDSQVYILGSKENNYEDTKKFEGLLKNAVIDLMKERKDTCSIDKENGISFSTYGYDKNMRTAVWNVLVSAGVSPSYYSGDELFIDKDKSKQRLFEIINGTTPNTEISITKEAEPVSNVTLLKAIKGL